jgi:hypothetical protein
MSSGVRGPNRGVITDVAEITPNHFSVAAAKPTSGSRIAR